MKEFNYCLINNINKEILETKLSLYKYVKIFISYKDNLYRIICSNQTEDFNIFDDLKDITNEFL